MMYKNKASAKLSNIAYALIIGGALGNLSDRLIHGFVIDFLDFYVGDWHWPTFNIADVSICLGAALIIIESFFSLIRMPAHKKPTSRSNLTDQLTKITPA